MCLIVARSLVDGSVEKKGKKDWKLNGVKASWRALREDDEHNERIRNEFSSNEFLFIR